MPLRGILFDLDGTLVDRKASLDLFANELAQAHIETLEEIDPENLTRIVREADGQGYRPKPEVFQLLIKNLPWMTPPSEDELADFWYTTFPKCAQAMKHAYRVLETLDTRGFKLGIVTNGTERSQMGKIERLDFHTYVDTIVISETAGIKKPDPAIFQMALSELQLSPQETCFVGDHPTNDIGGAEALGLTGIWLSGHMSWPDANPPPKHPIDQLIQLLHFLDKAESS